MKDKELTCALVLGGYVNGYSVISELYDNNVREIVLCSFSNCLAAYSNKIIEYKIVKKNPDSLYEFICNLHTKYQRIIIFPTSDLQLEYLYKIYDRICSYCFIPFKKDMLMENLDKYNQYMQCKRLGIPFPNTVNIVKQEDIEKIPEVGFPVIIKPRTRKDQSTNVFRNAVLNDLNDFNNLTNTLNDFVSKGITFLASEVIPGDSSRLFTYVSFLDNNSNILIEWAGHKLSSFPNDFGVFASSTNYAPEQVMQNARKLLTGMGLFGVCCPEFKFDERDKKYKLMEINLRYMMWNRMGHLLGRDVAYTQYLYATGEKIEKNNSVFQESNQRVNYIYLKYELINLIRRKKYFKTFFCNIFSSNKNHYAVIDIKDLKPFIFDTISTFLNAFEKLKIFLKKYFKK